MELLTFSVVLAIFGIIALWFEVNSLKPGGQAAVSRAVVAMELRRQMDMPAIQTAIAQVRHLADTQYLGNGQLGHPANGHQSNGHAPSMNGHTTKPETPGLVEVDQFFSHMGELVRRGIADDEVFALMGPTISEMWHCLRPIRSHPAALNGMRHLDDFDYLYTAWLNWDHYHHQHVAPPRFVSHGVVASAH